MSDSNNRLLIERVKQLSKLQRKGTVKLKKMKVCGLAWFSSDIPYALIELDPRRDMIGTYVHELLHVNDPEMSETKIIALTRKVINNMNVEDIKYIMHHLQRVLV